MPAAGRPVWATGTSTSPPPIPTSTATRHWAWSACTAATTSSKDRPSSTCRVTATRRPMRSGSAAAPRSTRPSASGAYSELQKLLTQEVANVYLLELEFPTLSRANVKNLVTTAIGLNESFDKVYIDKK